MNSSVDVVNTGYSATEHSTPASGSGGSSPTSTAVPDYSESVPEHDMDDEELQGGGAQRGKVEPRKGGYSSRIEQILYEHPELDIQIVAAGKNTEGGGGYITYTIRTGVCWTAMTRILLGVRQVNRILTLSAGC